ncbi:MAG: hypothetical protein NWE93_12480 [Candidatus Bathyarchaeota archaeon]|nr:hypothetical protein [Candidatus Bathyarchaeota archaeon]
MRRIGVLLLAIVLIVPCTMIFNPVTAATSDDSWETKAQMPIASSGLGAAVCNEKIYAIGGYDEKWKLTGTNQMYNPSSDSWTIQASMPTPRSFFGIAVCQNKIYVIGGANKSGLVPFSNILEVTGVTNINEVYDPATNTWQTMSPMPTPRSNIQTNVVENKIYVTGGFTFPNFELINSMEVYDPLTDSWSNMSPMPIHQSKFSSVVYNDKIYCINDNITQIFDPKTDTWTSASPPPDSVYQSAAGATTETTITRLYFFSGGTNFDLTQIYDPARNIWTQGVSMLSPRIDAAVAVFNDTFFLMGGTEPNYAKILAVNEKYLPADYGGSDDQETLTESASSDQTQTFHTTLLAATAVAIALVTIGLAAYFRKNKHT